MNNNDISLILQVGIASASISVFQVFYSGNSKDLESSLGDQGQRPVPVRLFIIHQCPSQGG